MRYKLKNENYEVDIDSLGAEIKSFLFKKEQYLHSGDEIYWHRSSPVLFPIVGRLKKNNYFFNNKSYRLPIHGFARFYEFELVEQIDEKLSFKLIENKDTLKHYPFAFELILSYTLTNKGLKIDYKVSSSEEEIYFSLGVHPAFLLKANIDDTFFTFEKDEDKWALPLNLEYGCICDEKRVALKGNILKLEKNIFENDALIFKNLNSKVVTLNNSKNKKSVRVNFDGFEYIAFWQPVGASFVCIEPWCGIADNINTNHNFKQKQSIIKLKKNQTFSKSLFISLN